MILMLLLTGPALAQQVCLKVSTLHVLASTIKLDLEASASPMTSFTLSPSYTNTVGSGDGVKGGGLEAGFRIYFNNDSLRMRGHYLHGTLSYGSYETIWTEMVSESNVFYWHSAPPKSYPVTHKELITLKGFDVVWGYQFILHKHFCIDLYAGVGIRHGGSSQTILVPGIDPGYNGPILKTGAKFGVAF